MFLVPAHSWYFDTSTPPQRITQHQKKLSKSYGLYSPLSEYQSKLLQTTVVRSPAIHSRSFFNRLEYNRFESAVHTQFEIVKLNGQFKVLKMYWIEWKTKHITINQKLQRLPLACREQTVQLQNYCWDKRGKQTFEF